MENQTDKTQNMYPDRPRAAVGAIVFKEDRALLVKRGKPPAESQWAIPGGSIELGESLQEAAEREILEEAGIVIRAGDPVFAFDTVRRDDSDRIRFHYVIVDVTAEYVSGEIRAGDDAADARWVSAEEINDLGINQVTRHVLRKHFGFGSE